MAVGARKITNRGTKKIIGKFPSLKMNTAIWWESQLERDYIYLLEIDPDVLSVDHTTIYRWVMIYAPEMEKRSRKYLKTTNDSWRVDETYIKVKGKWKYLC